MTPYIQSHINHCSEAYNMATIDIMVPKIYDSPIQVHTRSQFHSFGNPNDLYLYDGLEVWEGSLRDESHEEWNKRYYRYQKAVMKHIQESNEILPGDIVYIETNYESRQYYGVGFVTVNPKTHKKGIDYYASSYDYCASSYDLIEAISAHFTSDFFEKTELECWRYVMDIGEGCCDHRLTETLNKFRRAAAAHIIQKKWRNAIANPAYTLCRNRLIREFNEMNQLAN